MTSQELNARVELLGQAILESDGSPASVFEIMRGCPPIVFSTMDGKDNWSPVPKWHCSLRMARNTTGFFDALNDTRARQ